MHATDDWIEWVRTTLGPDERDALLSALTLEQKERLLKDDHVWVQGIGVLWTALDGTLRRACFTHGTYFSTARGAFYIDSGGNTRRI
jgi:hypothetical protein